MSSNAKEWVQYGSAIAMLASGVVLTFVSFLTSLDRDVPDNVLVYVGQCLVYAGSIFGVALYVKKRTDNVIDKVHNMVKKEETTDEAAD